MATNFFPRRSPSRYSLILVSLLTLVGILGGCGPSSTTRPSHPGGLTPTLTPTRQLKGTISEFPPIPGYQPGTITAGPDGALWFTEVSPHAQNGSATLTSKIGRITLAGQVSEFPLASNSYAGDITTGPDGALWFTTEASSYNPQNGSTTLTSKIERITPSGTISEFPLASNTLPKDITTGPDGALWFTEMSSYPVNKSIPTGKIGRITPAGHISEFPVPTGDSNGLGILGITTGPDGNLWFTESGKIERITPSGKISGFPLPSSNQPGSITTGPDNALWFVETVSNPNTKNVSSKIGRITPSGTISEFPLPPSNQPGSIMLVFGITTGPDGNLWFTESGKIGRITPSGTISEFLLPTSNSISFGITAGSDGALWFTEWDSKIWSGKIGRLA
jgi:streptogramin lyase